MNCPRCGDAIDQATGNCLTCDRDFRRITQERSIPMRQHYYYVRWAENLRLSEAFSIEDACKDAFGMVSTDMEVKDLGTRHPRWFSEKKKQELRESTDGWVKPKRNDYKSKKLIPTKGDPSQREKT